MQQRRNFLALLGSAVAWPMAARAQRKVPVVGYLYAGSPEEGAAQVTGFLQGLSEAGYVEGRNVAIEYRWARNANARLPGLVADLVRLRVDVLTTPGSMAAALAAKAATTTIPIVFGSGGDPVQTGLVENLNRPGGNVTGINYMNNELGGKRLQLLHELAPGAARFAVLISSGNPLAKSTITDAQRAASAIGRQIEVLTAGNSRGIDTALANLVEKGAEALLISPDILFANYRLQIIALAAHHAVPAIYPWREDVEAGGLMSYGASLTDQARLAGIYVGRILKGDKPADMPVMRATKFEFVINLKTAKALGLQIPPGILAIADEVIE
jgi:putative ABC transport system substrate-binding protein